MIVFLELFAFVFLYASVYENAAIVMGLYSYGRSLVTIGFVPASVPLIEAGVLITGFWFLEKTSVPKWAWAPIIGLFGMLQDFSLDPLAIRQVHTAGTVTSGRWNWLINWIMLAFDLLVPVLLLIFLWLGRMARCLTPDDLPVFIFPTVLHLSDIVFAIAGKYNEILWIVLLASIAHVSLLAFAWINNSPSIPKMGIITRT